MHVVPTSYWHELEDGRIQCDLCPRFCKLREGQRGLCFVRARQADAIVLTTWGRSSGFCVDPIEKKPLHHFLPGTPVLSFGTAGCNLACRFCQNWDISKSREIDTLADSASAGRRSLRPTSRTGGPATGWAGAGTDRSSRPSSGPSSDSGRPRSCSTSREGRSRTA